MSVSPLKLTPARTSTEFCATCAEMKANGHFCLLHNTHVTHAERWACPDRVKPRQAKESK